MKRLLAVVVAAGMIFGAVLLRDRLDDDGSGNDTPNADRPFRLTCATELATVCESLRRDDHLLLTIEDPGLTSDRLVDLAAGADTGFDAWLTDGPWDAITADNRRFDGPGGAVLGEPSAVLGRSPAVLVTNEAGRSSLPDDCEPRVSWSCIGQSSDAVRVGLPSPERGDGLVVLAGATAGFFGRTDYAANDFEQPGFTGWFDRITRLSAATRLGRQSPLEAALARQGLFNVVGALEAQSTRLLASRTGWATTYPEPVVTADVTLVPPAGATGDQVLERWGADTVGDALAQAGWRVDGSVPEGGNADLELPDGSGLPSPGVLQRLREMW